MDLNGGGMEKRVEKDGLGGGRERGEGRVYKGSGGDGGCG